MRWFKLDVRLVCPYHVCFPPSLREGLRLDVRLVSPCHVFFPPSLREGLRLDVRLVSPCHVFFPPSLREGLRLDVRLVSLSCAFPSVLKRGLSLSVVQHAPFVTNTRVGDLRSERFGAAL